MIFLEAVHNTLNGVTVGLLLGAIAIGTWNALRREGPR